MSQPPLLNEFQQGKVCGIVSAGGTPGLAARCVGCRAEAIRHTAECDADFREQLEKAQSFHELHFLQRIRAASEKDQNWRAAVWALERTYPGRYGARQADLLTPRQVSYLLRQLAKLALRHLPAAARPEYLADVRRLRAELRAESTHRRPARRVRRKSREPGHEVDS